MISTILTHREKQGSINYKLVYIDGVKSLRVNI